MLASELGTTDNLRERRVVKQAKRETKIERPRREIVDRETALERMESFTERQQKLIDAIRGRAHRGLSQMNFTVKLEQETDGRWIAEVTDIPGALAYGQSQEEALARVEALALRVIADRLDHGEIEAALISVSFAAA